MLHITKIFNTFCLFEKKSYEEYISAINNREKKFVKRSKKNQYWKD